MKGNTRNFEDYRKICKSANEIKNSNEDAEKIYDEVKGLISGYINAETSKYFDFMDQSIAYHISIWRHQNIADIFLVLAVFLCGVGAAPVMAQVPMGRLVFIIFSFISLIMLAVGAGLRILTNSSKTLKGSYLVDIVFDDFKGCYENN